MKRVYIVVLLFFSSMLVFAERAQSGLYLISDRDVSSNIGYSTRVASGKLWGMSGYGASSMRGTVMPLSITSVSHASAYTFVSADEVLQTASVPPAVRRVSPPPPSVKPGEAVGALPDAVWLLLLLAATYALFLHQRSKTV